MSETNDILEDLAAEIGAEIATIENLIGHSEAQLALDSGQGLEVDDQVVNIAYLKGGRDMALMCEQMVQERISK